MTNLNFSVSGDPAASRRFPAPPLAALTSMVGMRSERRQAIPRDSIARAVRARYRALLETHPHGGCGLELGRPGEDRWVAILPDPSGAASTFKVQPFDATGIGPHTGGYASPRAALWAALAAGYTEPAPGLFTRLAGSARWQARYQPPLAARGAC